jgi:hypothetical protein
LIERECGDEMGWEEVPHDGLKSDDEMGVDVVGWNGNAWDGNA